MSLLKARLRAFFHSLRHLHRIATFREIWHNSITSISCIDCGIVFYDPPIDHVSVDPLLGNEEAIFPKP